MLIYLIVFSEDGDPKYAQLCIIYFCLENCSCPSLLYIATCLLCSKQVENQSYISWCVTICGTMIYFSLYLHQDLFNYLEHITFGIRPPNLQVCRSIGTECIKVNQT